MASDKKIFIGVRMYIAMIKKVRIQTLPKMRLIQPIRNLQGRTIHDNNISNLYLGLLIGNWNQFIISEEENILGYI